ncbi:COG1361 S-layer family protein [Halorubrum vacuolatum]|uniref:Uncharacterized protein n=1 Tax=Halorubrum vacuolatum TaxID=63740 RepID=A0A238W4J9_HALVU|nr:hypothetical protein [Halorubrum vacuolatum]SNR41482.1 hypothetical protein SAMN06264855_105118 [Halorubrum vacuolatum]
MSTGRILPALSLVLCCLLAVAVVGALAGGAGAAGSDGASPEPMPTNAPLSVEGSPSLTAPDNDIVRQTDDSGSGSDTVRGRPRFDAFLSQPTVTTGGESTVTVDLLNRGEMRFGNELDDRVTTARSVRVEADADGTPLEVKSREAAVGDVGTGTPTSVPIDLAVPDDVDDGEYDVEVTVRYRYTGQITSTFNRHNDRTATERFDVTVVIDEGARFAIVDADTDAQVGGSGDVTVTMENVGDERARDAVVTGEATGSEVTVGDGASDVFVGDWEPGENRTATFDSTVGVDFAGEAYALRSTVGYRDSDGAESDSPAARTGVTPIPKQSFPIEDVLGTLEVGYAGTVTGTLENDGPLDVDDAVLIAEPQSDRVQFGESRYALPELADGEATEFSFDADVSGQADPGPRQIRFTVEYTSGDGTVAIESTDRIEVAPRQPEFDLVSENTTVPAGETRRFTFEITNRRPETLSSINAGLYADSPLSAVDDEAFVSELEPGESAEIWFEVAAASGASVKTHPVEIDFRYDDERGNDRISDVIQYPVEVTEPVDDGGGIPWIPVVIGVLVLVAAGGYVYSRRR